MIKITFKNKTKDNEPIEWIVEESEHGYTVIESNYYPELFENVTIISPYPLWVNREPTYQTKEGIHVFKNPIKSIDQL